VPFGQRAIMYSGTADLTTILQEEAEGKYIKRVQEETEKRGGMLVMGKFLSPIKYSYLYFFNRFADQFQSQEPTSYAINCEMKYVGT